MEDPQTVPSPSSWGWLSAVQACALIALLTGLPLALKYDAGADKAYAAVHSIQQTPFLAFLRSLHHWSSAGIIICGALFVFHSLLIAAYRKPLSSIWTAGVLTIGAGMLLQITGHLLPWDKQAVQTTVIETSIAVGAPVVGVAQEHLVRGGVDVGPATLSLWYTAHVTLFSLAMVALVGFLLVKLKNKGFSLAQQLKPGVTAMAVVALVSLAFMPKLGPAATALDFNSFDAKPEWYVLPMHVLLVFFDGINQSLGFIGTMVIPGLVLVLLLALPFIDRKPSGADARMGQTIGAVLGVGTLIIFATNLGRVASPMGEVFADTKTDPVVQSALDPAIIAKGKALFEAGSCSGCHMINGKGGNVGPDLSNEGAKRPSLAWQIDHLKNPQKVVPSSMMPAFNNLKPDELTALAQYLASLKK